MPPTVWAWEGFLTGMYKLMLEHILVLGLKKNGSGVSHGRRGQSLVCTGCSWVKGKGDSSCGHSVWNIFEQPLDGTLPRAPAKLSPGSGNWVEARSHVEGTEARSQQS